MKTSFQLVLRVEKALDQHDTASGVFLGIEWGLNNTCYDKMFDALVRYGIIPLYGGLGPP